MKIRVLEDGNIRAAYQGEFHPEPVNIFVKDREIFGMGFESLLMNRDRKFVGSVSPLVNEKIKPQWLEIWTSIEGAIGSIDFENKDWQEV